MSNQIASVNDEFFKRYSWISEDFVYKLIQKTYPETNIEEIEFSFKSALGKGENYSSQMIQIDVHYVLTGFPKERKQKSFIMKTEIKELDLITTEFNVFSKEIKIFEEILPKVDELLSSVNLQEQIGARFYGYGKKPFYLIFENLNSRGYRNLDRRYGLGYPHLQCVMKKLAKYHAATAVIGTTLQPHNAYSIYMESALNEETKVVVNMLKNSITACADVCKNWSGFENIYEKLIKIVDNITRKCCVAYIRNDNEFNVLCHGDLWSNNIMFKHTEDGQLQDAILVDFQIGYWGSPVLDLCNVLYISSASSITEQDWDNLIQYYYGILKTTLLKLNYGKPIPSLTEILSQVLKRGIFAAILSMLLLTLRKLEDEEDMNLDVLMADTTETHKKRVKILSRDDIKEHLQHYLNFCNRKGYLDD